MEHAGGGLGRNLRCKKSIPRGNETVRANRYLVVYHPVRLFGLGLRAEQLAHSHYACIPCVFHSDLCAKSFYFPVNLGSRFS
jgi:hypothetical protein